MVEQTGAEQVRFVGVSLSALLAAQDLPFLAGPRGGAEILGAVSIVSEANHPAASESARFSTLGMEIL